MSEGQLDGQTEGTGAISGYPATQSMTQVQGCERTRELLTIREIRGPIGRRGGVGNSGVHLG